MIGKKEQELFKSTLKLIKENPDHWDQGVWHCQTSHCFAGFVELQIRNKRPDEPFARQGSTRKIAMEALGITKDLDLFSVTTSLERIEEIVKAVTTPLKDICKLDLFVAQREDLPVELVEKLAEDDDDDVRCAIAQREDLPVELVEKLAEDDEIWDFI